MKNELREYPNCRIICTGDILAGKEAVAPSDVLAATPRWGAVHGPPAAYDLLAAFLTDKLSSIDRVKRGRDDGPGPSGAGSQRSRRFSFSDGAFARSRTAAGASPRFSETLISYPTINRGRGQMSNRFGYP